MCAGSTAPCICRIRGCWCQSCSDVCITPWQLANDPCCRTNCPQPKTIVQTTCWVLLDVSLLHKMHASMCFWSRCYFWIIMVKPSSHPLCIARWLAQQLVASVLLSKEPPKFPESTESLGKSVDSPFCLLRPALGWMQMINFQHFDAFLAEKCYSLPGRWVSTHATWRWGGQNLSSLPFV